VDELIDGADWGDTRTRLLANGRRRRNGREACDNQDEQHPKLAAHRSFQFWECLTRVRLGQAMVV
jgi:hypothetical protein